MMGLEIILHTVIRTILAFLILIAVERLLGRRAISQMTFFDFALTITFGSVTANIGLDKNHTFTSGITMLLTLGILGGLTGLMQLRSMRFKKFMSSEPVIVINNGEIVKKNMKKTRLTVSKLMSLLREKNCFNISDINFAIFENDGKLSVLPKAAKKPLTPSDMQMKPPEKGLTKDIIIDGKVLYENLRYTNVTETWLMSELKSRGINNAKEVFYAAIETNGALYVTRGDKRTEKQGEYGIE